MAPQEFIKARESSSIAIVCNKPYYPNLKVDPQDHSSITLAAIQLLCHKDEKGSTTPPPTSPKDLEDIHKSFQVTKVTGGITNALFRISGLSSLNALNNDSHLLDHHEDAILVRVFGAEGMIDRDVETSTFSSLADKGIAPPYHGRFGNGRLEGWLENYAPLSLMDLQNDETIEAIAEQMAKLHVGYTVPDDLKEYHDETKPALWSQLYSWMDQATNISNFKSQHDDARAKELLDLPKIAKELEWLKSDSIPKDAKVAFCHNDLLAGNIMKHTINGNIQLIDFEYGGVNFVAFDIANHFNEFAGGTENKEGQTNYDLFPCETKRRAFIGSYLRTASGLESSESESVEPTEQDIQAMHLEVQAFVLANHIYWGLWAVNQAAMEGTEEFDYMAYATNRFNQYYKNKAEFQ